MQGAYLAKHQIEGVAHRNEVHRRVHGPRVGVDGPSQCVQCARELLLFVLQLGIGRRLRVAADAVQATECGKVVSDGILLPCPGHGRKVVRGRSRRDRRRGRFAA
jgi:hypothetical protein